MKKISLFILAAALCPCSMAQPTFMKIFRATGTAQSNLNEMSSGNLRLGLARQSGTSLFDPQGTLLQSHSYSVDTFLVLQSVKRYADNDFWFAGLYYKDTCSLTGALRTYPVIGRMDSLGNVLSVRHYPLNAPECSNGAGDLEVLSTGSVIAWGTRDYRFFALRVDPIGEPVWAKRFSEEAAFRFIKELPGGDLLAGLNMDQGGAVVARLDPAGNFIWCKSYIRPKGMIHDCVIESDNEFVITGFTDSVTVGGGIFFPPPPPFHPKLFMMKLNGAGEVQWCRGYNSEYNWVVSSASRIVKAQDGNYVVLSNIRTQDSVRPFLMKTDTSGDTLWTRSNGRTNYVYETRNLLATADGGLLYNGRIWGNLPDGQANWAYLYKADAQGHLPCFERWHPVEVQDLFPVDSSFTLTSVDGATALPAYVTDTIADPIVVYDGCSFSTAFPAPLARKYKVYPNPNTGRFTVQFADPLMAQSYYSVYDAMGQLLYQRPLPQGQQTQEVDLSRYSTGTYVIKFTSPEGVCYERVVVE